MKLYKALFFLISLLLFSCKYSERNIEVPIRKTDCLKIVSDFSQQFDPNGYKNLNSINIEVVEAFYKLRTINKKAHETYVTLVFAKLYAEHLTCCHQGFIIASNYKDEFNIDKISMVNELAFISNYVDYKNLPEAWSSGIIEKWINENPRFLENLKIKKEVEQIDKINGLIKENSFWEK